MIPAGIRTVTVGALSTSLYSMMLIFTGNCRQNKASALASSRLSLTPFSNRYSNVDGARFIHEIPDGFGQFGKRVSLVDWHDFVPGRVDCRVKRYGKVETDVVICQSLDASHDAGGG
ncbi:MAG: hypothetical protein ACLTZT_13630 [Butyricimonas faecalis]